MNKIPIPIKIILLIGLLLLRNLEYFKSFIDDYKISKTLNFIIFLFIANILFSILRNIYKKQKELDAGQVNNVLLGGRNIYYLLVGLGTIGYILSIAGVHFGTLFTSLSIIAAAIAIVTREFLTSIIAGFHIALSKTLGINDYVKIGELKGRVVDIKLQKLKLLSEDDDLIVISNDKAYFSDIINYTKGNIRRVTINFDLGFNFVGTVEELEEGLVDAITDYDEYIETNSYALKVVEVLKDSIKFKFQYELKKNEDRDLAKEIRKITIRKVINQIKSENTPT